MIVETRANYNTVITTNNPAGALIAAGVDLPQEPSPVIHHFGPGVYIREAHYKAGTLVVGHAHKQEHTNFFLKGKLRMFCDDGSFQDLAAPMMFVGQPGPKIAYILEDTIWQNIYSTTERDIEKLEELLFEPDPAFILSEGARLTAATALRSDDRLDYTAMCEELHLDPTVIYSVSRNLSDQRAFPYGPSKVKTSPSPIQGTGLFCTAPILAGEVIAPARIAGLRTPAGRFTNHSPNPNAAMALRSDGNIDLVALFDLRGCVGGRDGEEITVDYRQALKANYKLQEELCQQQH